MKWSITLLCLLLSNGELTDVSDSSGPVQTTHGDQTNATAAETEPVEHHTETVDPTGTSTSLKPKAISDNGTDAYLGDCSDNLLLNNTICPNSSKMFNQKSVDDNNESLVSRETVDNAKLVIQLILTPCLCFFGGICNILNIYILTRKSMRSSTNYYLTALSVADFSYLLTVLGAVCFLVVRAVDEPRYVRALVSMRWGIFEYWLTLASGRTSHMLILVVSIERFIAVKFPLKARLNAMNRHPLKIIVGIFSTITILLFPNMFHHVYDAYVNEKTNVTVIIYRPTELFKSNPDMFRGYLYFLLITLRFIPVFFVLSLNICIIYILKRSQKSTAAQASAHEKRDKEQIKITRMLVAIAVAFLICVMPLFIHTILNLVIPGYAKGKRYENLWHLLYILFPFLDVINSAINFFIYVFKNAKFRTLLLESICGKFTVKKTG